MNIVAVIVTFNRKELLEAVLSTFDCMENGPDQLIVVNNNSSDGTTELLDIWRDKKSNFEKHVINLESNIGGSGGFYTGLEFASKLDPDWVWLSDDDAFPETDSFSKFRWYLNNIKDTSKISAICGKVVNNGEIDLAHRRRLKDCFFFEKEVVVDFSEYFNDSFEFDLFSYVGVFINNIHLNKVGLTEKNYFIWYDDTEHSYRLRDSGKILCLPNISIRHDVGEPLNKISWKNYYGIRNRLLMYKKKSFKTYVFLSVKFCFNSIFKDRIERGIIFSALLDAYNNVDGLHCIYKPGWSVREDK